MKKIFFGLLMLMLMTGFVFATPINIKEGRVLSRFFISKVDTTLATTEYYGYQAEEGDWYIMRETAVNSTTPSFTYAGGSSGFSSAWTNHTTLTYEAFSSN